MLLLMISNEYCPITVKQMPVIEGFLATEPITDKARG